VLLLQEIAKPIKCVTYFIIYHMMFSLYDKWISIFTFHFDVSSTLLNTDTIDRMVQIQN